MGKPAFLSSLFQDLRGLRQQLHDEMFPDLFVAEIDRPDLHPDSKEPLDILDELVEELQRSEIFICVLAGDRDEGYPTGTPISIENSPTAVSYFEIEVFQAALHRIPAIFLVRHDFKPGHDLEEFLRILADSGIAAGWVTHLTESQLRAEVRSTIESRAKLREAARVHLVSCASNLAEALLLKRSHLPEIRSGGSDILWLQGRQMRTKRSIRDLDEIKRLLDLAASEARHKHRLSRLYIVLRELMGFPYDETIDPMVLQLWNNAFGMWWGSAAWYGLHSHLSMGVIASLWSQGMIRRRMISSGLGDGASDLSPPYGSLASAYFSLAKLLRSPKLRWRTSGAGLFLANKQIKLADQRDATIYAVRGSLFFLRLDPIRGMLDFHHLLKLAHLQPQNIALNAEAHTYLGRGYGHLRMFRRSERHLGKAVTLSRKRFQETEEGIEFLIKSLKHLLEFQIRRGRHDAANRTAEEALRLCQEADVSDQERQIQSMLATRVAKERRSVY